MRIHKLIVKKTKPVDEIIREITFKPKGLNLIVDNTTDVMSDSGNSVGKTTVIKIIDLCLGAKSVRELYYDEDTKSENKEIKNFLSTYKVQAVLILIDSQGNKTVIRRDLFLNGKKFIEEKVRTESEFWFDLKRILFNSTERSPTFRELIPKIVRVSNTSEDSMIRYLPKMVTKDTYDAIYSFLFQFLETDLVSKKNELCIDLSDCQKTINMLEKTLNISSVSALKQKVELIDNDLQEHIDNRKQLSYIENYKEELENKRKLITKISECENKIQLLDYEIVTIKESLNKLSDEKCNINLNLLKQIYIEAKGYDTKLQKSFEELVLFHNEMIQNRMDFITEQLQTKKNLYNSCSSELDNLLNEKKQITLEIIDDGLLDDLNILNRKIEVLSVQKGEIIQSIKLLEEQEKIKANLEKSIKDIEAKSDKNNIIDNLNIFNQIFSEYCDQLYGEKYLLAYNNNWRNEKNKFPITIESLGGKLGTGKKKAVIVAFDLAYMKYAEIKNISAPQFVIHDKLENTHINQLKTIFEICQTINGQYIIPILRERIDKVESRYIEEAKVLELSSENKFFGV